MISLPSHARSADASGRMIPPSLDNLDNSTVAGIGDIDVAHRIECDPSGPNQIRSPPLFRRHRREQGRSTSVVSITVEFLIPTCSFYIGEV
jgi:hypothetical protein